MRMNAWPVTSPYTIVPPSGVDEESCQGREKKKSLYVNFNGSIEFALFELESAESLKGPSNITFICLLVYTVHYMLCSAGCSA